MPMQDHAPLPPPTAPQFFRYAGSGAVGTAVHYAVLVALVAFADAGAVEASTMGALVGAAVNYALNHRFTFRSRKTHGTAFPRFALVAAAGIVLNALVLATVLAIAGPHYLVAQLVATCAVLAAGFLANRAWTF